MVEFMISVRANIQKIQSLNFKDLLEMASCVGPTKKGIEVFGYAKHRILFYLAPKVSCTEYQPNLDENKKNTINYIKNLYSLRGLTLS